MAELGFFAALEASAAGTPVSDATWGLLCAMTDVMAALVDERVRPPRQGDSDEGRVVLLDPPAHEPLAAAAGARRRAVRAARLVAAGGAGRGQRADRSPAGRPAGWSVAARRARPDRFADAGITIFRTKAGDSPEIYCRLDGGPHGFLSIAAHAHADALSVEVRYGGVDILADPGTYCYHGEPEWRKYFQSTIGHNTIEVDGQWQSGRGGAFLWLRHARGNEITVTDDGTTARWEAEHDGYAALSPPAVHHRTVQVDRGARSVEITDAVAGGARDVRLAFHLGPDVEARLEESVAVLDWPAQAGRQTARLSLPAELRWKRHRGETDPVLGWYSAGLGHRVPSWTLIGTGRSSPGTPLRTFLEFIKCDEMTTRTASHLDVSLSEASAVAERAPESQAESQ